MPYPREPELHQYGAAVAVSVVTLVIAAGMLALLMGMP